MIKYETDSMPQVVAPAEAAPEPGRIDFTHKEPDDVVRFAKERHRITAA